MIDQEKLDWKEPLWAKFKSYAIGFCSAVLVVALLLSVLYLWKGSEAALEKPAVAVDTMPAVVAKSKSAVKSIRRPVDAAAPVTAANPTAAVSNKKPRIDDGFTAEFDKQLSNLESKIP